MPFIKVLPAVFILGAVVIGGALLLQSDGEDAPSDSVAPSGDTGPASANGEPTASTATGVLRVSIDLPEPLSTRAHEQLAQLAGERDIAVRASAAAQDGDIVVALAGANEEPVATIERWIAVTSVWNLRESIDLAQEAPSSMLLPAEHRHALESLLPPEMLSGAAWVSLPEITDTLAAHPTLVSLLPLDEVLKHGALKRLLLEPGGDAWLEQGVTVTWSDPGWAEHGGHLTGLLHLESPQLITLAFTGDIIPARCVYERQRALGDYSAAFRHVAPYLSAADITVGSLDASLSDVGTPYTCVPTFNLLAPSQSIEGLELAGFDVMTLATNHIKDCGQPDFGCGDQALIDTLALLRGSGIEPVGAGENIAAARRAGIVEHNGVRFAFLGSDEVASFYLGATDTSPGTAPLEAETLLEDIAIAKTEADVVIVMPQWGVEYTPTPTDTQLSLGRAAIEAGATLVVGNHPHVVQGTEAIGGNFIAYALGNFVFDQDWSVETEQGVVLEATFAGPALLSVAFKPVYIQDMFQPIFVQGEEAESILERMRNSSEALKAR